MLPKKNRLSLRNGLFLKNKKLVFGGRLFNIFVHQNNSTVLGVAIIVPNSVAASSVARHKIKRRLAETIYPYLKTLPPLKILIYTKEAIAHADFSKIEKEVAVGIRLL